MRVLYSHEKRKLPNGQFAGDNYEKLWKAWKETAFIKLYSILIDLLAFELDKLCPRVGIFASFFLPGDFDEKKIVAQGSARGGGHGNRSN